MESKRRKEIYHQGEPSYIQYYITKCALLMYKKLPFLCLAAQNICQKDANSRPLMCFKKKRTHNYILNFVASKQFFLKRVRLKNQKEN